jgi:hypothetical protein
MSLSSAKTLSTIAIIAMTLQAGVVAAAGDGFILGFGGEADSSGGRAVTAFGDIGLTEETWVSALVSNTRTKGGAGSIDTLYADAAIDHWFKPIGVRVGAGYWGDEKILDSNDFRASVYFRNDAMSVSADYERRNFDFVFRTLLLPEPRTVGFYGDGYGLKTRFKLSDSVSMSAGGMTFHYSRRISRQPNIDVLRIFSASRLALVNSLLDYRLSAGMDWSIGLRNVDIRLDRWQTAVDQGNVDSAGVGLITPIGEASDLELRLAYDRSENLGESVTFSVFFYFFGA